MSGFQATTTDGRTVLDITPADLHPLLTADAGLVVFSSPADPEQDVRAAAATSGWTVEVRNGNSQLTATVPNADAVFDIMRSWASHDDWWSEAFTWVESEAGLGD